MDFKEQIKSPKWQKKRLEILNRDNFTCQSCGNTNETLHVHHIKYIKDKMYWDYPDSLLITLCEECHDTEHMCKSDFIHELLHDLNSSGLTYIEICGILGYVFNQSIMGIYEKPVSLPAPLTDIFNGCDLSYYIKGDVGNISKWRKTLKEV